MTGERWLILSYFSRIDGMACAQHIDDRIPFFREHGITPVMLTSVCGDPWPDGVPQARVPSVAPSGLRFELRHLRRRGRLPKWLATLLLLPVLPFYVLEKAVFNLDSQWSWFPLAILRGVRLCREQTPRVIYATGGAPSAHLAAAWISRLSGIPWISEFQDPLVHEDWQRSRCALKVYAWLERLVCARANAVVFLTDAARNNARSRTALGERGATVYPGSDPGNMPSVPYQRGEFCRFAHFGSFWGSRNLKVFLEGLGAVLKAQPELASSVRLDLYGTCDGLSRGLIERFPYPGVICDFGRVPRQESLAAMKRCDVLLLIQNTEIFSAETIPSKVYEYLHAGRPVLGLVHRNPELAGILDAQGDLAVAADDAGQVQEGILGLVTRWQRGELSLAAEPSAFTVRQAVDKIVDLAAEIV